MAESAPCRVFSNAAINAANRSDGRSNQRSPPLGFIVEEVLRPFREVGVEPTCGTGVEPVTASSQNWCSTSELTAADDFRSKPMFGTGGGKPSRVPRMPLDGRHQRCLLSQRRRWESNPLNAALQAAATPCDISVIKSVSLPGVEPGLRPSQSRVLPLHLKNNREKYPAEESNLVRLLRKQSCVLHTRRASSSLSRPGFEPGPGPSESPMQSATPSGQSRRLDSHQYGSAYKADAFLSRATSAIKSARA